MPAVPLRFSLTGSHWIPAGYPRRRHVLCPTGSQPAILESDKTTLKICSDPAVKRSHSVMEAASDFVPVEDDEYIDKSKALVVYEKKEECWQVTFQDYKRLKSDLKEGTRECPSSNIVQETVEEEEYTVLYDGEDLQDEEWVEFLAHNRPDALRSLTERLDVYDEEQLRLAMRRERRLRRERGPDWFDYDSMLPKISTLSCPSSPDHNMPIINLPPPTESARIVEQICHDSLAGNLNVSRNKVVILGNANLHNPCHNSLSIIPTDPPKPNSIQIQRALGQHVSPIF